MSCKDCRYSMKRCAFSYKQYGSYHCSYECSLPENEKTPYRRSDDNCEKYIHK